MRAGRNHALHGFRRTLYERTDMIPHMRGGQSIGRLMMVTEGSDKIEREIGNEPNSFS